MRRGKLIENGEQGINLKDFEESAAFFRKYKEKWIAELKCLIKDYQKALFHNDNGSQMIKSKQSSMKDPVAQRLLQDLWSKYDSRPLFNQSENNLVYESLLHDFTNASSTYSPHKSILSTTSPKLTVPLHSE